MPLSARRRTLQKNDIAQAIERTEYFDFLLDIVPTDETRRREEAAAGRMGGATAGPPGAPGIAPGAVGPNLAALAAAYSSYGPQASAPALLRHRGAARASC